LLPGSYGLLDDGLTAGVSKLVPEPFENPLGRVPLLLGSLAVLLEDLMNNRQKWPQLRFRSRPVQLKIGWFFMPQNLIQGLPMDPVVP